MSTNPLLGIGKWLPKSCNNTYGFICNRDLGEFMPLLLAKVKKNKTYETNNTHMVKQKQKAWHHPHFPLANTGWNFNALYMYLISVLCRPKHHASTWYNPSYLCDSGQWQFEGCDQKSHLGGCQKELWGWKSQLGFYTKPVVPGLRWTDGHESQSPCLDWTQQKNGTRLCVRLTQCIIRKDVRLNPEISILPI